MSPSAQPTRAEHDPAPALTRGLGLLIYLNREGASSLDRLARARRLPKSSTLRLLRCLELSGLVVRERTSKRYRALARFVQSEGNESLLRLRCAEAAALLCRTSGQTIEIYLFESQRLTMIDRAEPEDTEVTVRARLGFVRRFDEFDAATTVALAFGGPGVAWPRACYAVDRGAKVPLTRKQVVAVVREAREAGSASDLHVNGVGVRRYAAPLLDVAGGLIGVLALARAGATPRGPDDQRYLRMVRAAVSRIGTFETRPPALPNLPRS